MVAIYSHSTGTQGGGVRKGDINKGLLTGALFLGKVTGTEQVRIDWDGLLFNPKLSAGFLIRNRVYLYFVSRDTCKVKEWGQKEAMKWGRWQRLQCNNHELLRLERLILPTGRASKQDPRLSQCGCPGKREGMLKVVWGRAFSLKQQRQRLLIPLQLYCNDINYNRGPCKDKIGLIKTLSNRLCYQYRVSDLEKFTLKIEGRRQNFLLWHQIISPVTFKGSHRGNKGSLHKTSEFNLKACLSGGGGPLLSTEGETAAFSLLDNDQEQMRCRGPLEVPSGYFWNDIVCLTHRT